MLLRTCFLFFAGASAGGVVAAGVFAFLAIIGVFPRLIGITHTASRVMFYETMLILGGVWGNALDLYHVPFVAGGPALLVVFGLASGIFVGGLVMSLAETLKALPVLNRRIRLAVGLQYVILGIAAGKLAGSVIYFVKNFGGA